MFSDIERVADRERGLDAAPTPDGGDVVGFYSEKQLTTALPGSFKRCQVCPARVDVSEPHLRAVVRVAQEIEGARTTHSFKRPVFCSRGCWREWASAGE